MGRLDVQTPYVVGRWVKGADHYDRQSLIEYLLTAQDTAIWVVGTRRMGKTSLLRQIELMNDPADSPYLPVYWDLQGFATVEQLTEDLCWGMESCAHRFVGLDLDWDELRACDVATLLRRVCRALRLQNRQLLLLIDEAEALIQVSQSNPTWLARLRKALQEGSLRTILVSTRQLAQLTDESSGWMTSPFLFGFHLVVLWPLKRDGAAALVRQLQGRGPVQVDDALVEQILHYTNHHPYLIQSLCDRLYGVDEQGQGYLRPIQEDDLVVSHMLADYFQFDFQRLTEIERALLLAVAARAPMTQTELAEFLAPADGARLPVTLQALQELGHLRREGDAWVVGSEFLRRWLLLYHGLEEEPSNVAAPAPASIAVEERLSEANVAQVAAELGVAAERLHSPTQIQVQTASDFFHLVRSFFYEIRHLVEQDEGYRLLVTQGTLSEPVLRSEEEIQIALKHWLQPMCRAANINLDRESQTGRGLLDFKLSIGRELRCLVEVKLYSSAKLQAGLGIQLPIYLLADRSIYGIYVPVFLESTDYNVRVRELNALAMVRARSHNIVIDVIDLRAWRPRSASKAEVAEDPARYVPPAVGGPDDAGADA
jgi:hypothetical protein